VIVGEPWAGANFEVALPAGQPEQQLTLELAAEEPTEALDVAAVAAVACWPHRAPPWPLACCWQTNWPTKAGHCRYCSAKLAVQVGQDSAGVAD